MTTVHKLVRLGEEIEECGGDPKLLSQKLDSDLKLSEQIEHHERTLQGIKDNITYFLNKEREALARRDDALEAQKIAKKQLDATMEQLATIFQTGTEAEKITKALQEAKKTLKETEEKAAGIEHYNATGMWLLGLLFEQPSLLQKYRELVNGPPPPKQEYTSQIAQQILDVAIGEIQKHGDLVPKSLYVAASLAADNQKRRQSMVFDLLRDPTRSTPEQRRALLGLLIDLGVTPENFEQFRKELSIPWRKCPTHHADLKVNPSTFKWACTSPGCNYVDPW